jgi:nucleotide-binding universal stress UspA family protein
MAWQPKTIVVPIDFSDHSFAALDTALDIVPDASRVFAVHVLPTLLVAEPGVIWETVGDEERKLHVEQQLRGRTSAAKYAGLKTVVLIGDPGQEITALAEQVQADLIVMPSHGRTGLKRLLIGSVAERVVRLAHCPVLVLRH